MPPAGATSRTVPMMWKIKAPDRRGKYDPGLKVRSSTGVSQAQPVTISGKPGIFD